MILGTSGAGIAVLSHLVQAWLRQVRPSKTQADFAIVHQLQLDALRPLRITEIEGRKGEHVEGGLFSLRPSAPVLSILPVLTMTGHPLFSVIAALPPTHRV